MRTIAEEWESYKKACYPGGMHPEQHRQVKNAFYAGALCMFAVLVQASEKPDAEAEAILVAYSDELRAYDGAVDPINQ